MALNFTEASTVQTGAAITSSQWNKLADSFNDRLLAGVGDPTYRLHWYWHSLFRNLRLNNGLLYAPEDEWWKIYAHATPFEATFPTTSAGQPEGAFLGNPIAGFVFGNNDDIESEPNRLSYDTSDGSGILLHNVSGAPTTDSEKWDIGRYQRGVVEGSDTTNLTLANSLVAARSHFSMGFFRWYQRSYGGFLPQPEYLGQCSNSPDIPSFALRFTRTSDNTAFNYSTCPGQTNAVFSWWQTAQNFVLLTWEGALIYLPVDEYIEGPYDGANNDAFLTKPNGQQLARALNYFIEPFKGTAGEQLSSTYKAEDKAFDFEGFFNKQYYLAPAYGEDDGSGTIEATYERFNFNNAYGPDSYGALSTGATSYAIHAGFVLAGVLAYRSAGTGEKVFQVEVDGASVGQVTIPNGQDSASMWIAAPTGGTVKIKSITGMGASDVTYVEIAELLEYKPENEDAYLVLRCASANNSTNEAEGTTTTQPKDISDNYFRHGMIYNGARADIQDETVALNKNPVYRSVSEKVRERLRMVDRHGLKGYEVVSGKSVLYFDRQAFGASYADLFEGIGPAVNAIASGAIKAGYEYTVSGGTSIVYNGATVASGAQFTGVHDVKTFTKTGGTESVYEYEGIRNTAPKAGYDNRWSMFMQSMSYQPASGSAYKPDAYTDIVGWGHDRCAMFSSDWTPGSGAPGQSEILGHVTPYKGKILQRSENPTGYRYLLNTHDMTYNNVNSLIANELGADCDEGTETGDCTGMEAHYKSCKIYTPDYRITSARDAGNNQVRVELDRRLECSEDAPGTVSNTSTNRSSYITADSNPTASNGAYRTDENAVIEYLRYTVDGGANCGQRIGDFAPDATTASGHDTSSIQGACMPRFYFTRLIPKVYADGNASYQATDTLLKSDELTWLETTLRAVCEGYIDEDSSNTQREYLDGNGLTQCYDKRLYDYSFESLMYKANGTQHYRELPATERSDSFKGFGALPGMKAYADHFNQIANAVNKLTRARLYLPVQFQFKHYDYLSQVPIAVDTNAANPTCSGDAVWADGQIYTANYSLVFNDTNWRNTGSITGNAFKRCYISSNSSNQCVLECNRRDVHYRFALVNHALKSLPADLQTLVSSDTAVGFSGIDEYQVFSTDKGNPVSQGSGRGFDGLANGGENDYKHGGNFYKWTQANASPQFLGECIITTGGVLEANDPPTSDYVDTEQGNYYLGAGNNRNITANSIQAFIEVPLV